MPEYPIRPGLVLSWGVAAPLFPAPTDAPSASAFFIFVLAGDSTHGNDRMFLSSGRSGAALSGLLSPCAFHVTLRLSDSPLQELLLDDKSPGTARLREVTASTSPVPPALPLPHNPFSDFSGSDSSVSSVYSVGPSPTSPALSLPLTPSARLAVESIRRCPFAGACRAMALTARAHDLLVEFLTALSAVGASSPRPSPLTRTTDDHVRAAAEFLAQHLEEPPTLAALARHVGLSETTLKRGFHQVFGTTVFGYLRTRRMERAHALLQSGEATVLEASTLVGYSNPSNFSAAFRRQFGLNPKAFQLTARR